jgi:hypothetical protein
MGYTDASFQTDHDDLRSQSGFVFVLISGVVSWKSSKQETITDSTIEVEYNRLKWEIIIVKVIYNQSCDDYT